ncbi:hypothetical protein [Nocardioides sp.]|uniref:hypothetical protein n=1 Tax=Nocardioides sp. TaxID=35761 RepID=UPI003D0ECE15
MMSQPGRRPRAVRAVVLAATAWVTVVALGSTLVWAVISRAGEGVVGGTVAGGEPASTGGGTPAPAVGSPSLRSPSAHPSHPRASSSATADASESSGPSDPATTGDSAPTRPAGGHHQTSSSPSGPAAPPPATPEQRTWSNAAGSVTAQCTGTRIRYRSALPQTGYKVEWEYEGPSQLKVKFERTGEQEGETEVRATCRNGVPQFRSESKGDD